jgi:uncharacterized membrane protein YjgN (DUF898 family)
MQAGSEPLSEAQDSAHQARRRERERLFRELGDSPLRDEMFPDLVAAERAQSDAAAQAQAALDAASTRYRLQFTGDGAEYFRIWVVNLLLTVATLGLYSAWAKVRKTRYFWQNTRLAGHVFDYHGAPAAILRGRILAVILLAAYSWAFDISRSAGLVTIAVLCLIGPWLFMKAQQFKFRNTSHRGLRFDFGTAAQPAHGPVRGPVADAYVTLLPLLVIWFSGTVAGVLAVDSSSLAAWLGVVSVGLFPWMHQRLKSYQHARVRYGDQQASFETATAEFYWTYFKGIFVVIGASLVAALIGAGAAAVAAFVWKASGRPMLSFQRELSWIIGLLVFGLGYLMLWPYYAARLQRIVWDKTRLGPLRFVTTMMPGPLFKLVLVCTLWTVLTLGLYWPFAAVRLARYRVESLEVLTAEPLEQAARGVRTASAAAAGEGAVDLFGLDVGL